MANDSDRNDGRENGKKNNKNNKKNNKKKNGMLKPLGKKTEKIEKKMKEIKCHKAHFNEMTDCLHKLLTPVTPSSMTKNT